MNLSSLLVYPIFISFALKSNPLSAAYLMISATGLTLKLVSFHHVMHDNRILLRKLAKDGTIDMTSNQSGLPNDLYKQALKYP